MEGEGRQETGRRETADRRHEAGSQRKCSRQLRGFPTPAFSLRSSLSSLLSPVSSLLTHEYTGFDGLVHGLHGHESQPPIEPDRAFILGRDFEVTRGSRRLDGSPAGHGKGGNVPRPAPRCSGAMPRFWMAPMPVRVADALDGAAVTRAAAPARGVQVSSQVALGRKPGLRTISLINRSAAVELARGRETHWHRSRSGSSGTWPRKTASRATGPTETKRSDRAGGVRSRPARLISIR